MCEQHELVCDAWYGHVSLKTRLWSMAHLNALSGRPPSQPMLVVSQSISSCSDSLKRSPLVIALRDSMAAIEEKAQHEPHDSCSRIGFMMLG